MSIRRFSTASISTGNSKSTKLWDQETFQSGMFALATISLTSNQSSVSFSSIPSNYTHLQIRHIAKDTSASSGASGIVVRFNGDSTASYAFHYLNGEGSLATATSGTGSNHCNINFGNVLSGSNTSTFAAGVTDILDYSLTSKTKTIRSVAGVDLNGSGGLALSSNLWTKTEAINSILILPFTSTFAADSRFALYGIKAG